MTKQTVQYSVATPGKILVKSAFKNYDIAGNPYVGCQFGCSYCYVRFTVKDPQLPWGDFVRVREHLQDALTRELDRGYVRLEAGSTRDAHGKRKTLYRNLPIQEARLVIGTMTDPYQPAELKYGITQTMLEILTGHTVQFAKVGLFTRSPLALRDAELISKLPKARVHFTVTPFPHNILRTIEPISANTNSRFNVIRKLKAAGLRVHVNVSPVIPLLSDQYVDEFAKKLAELKVDEFFVDPMQAYKESFDAFRTAMRSQPGLWQSIETVMTDKTAYEDWKQNYKQDWLQAWARYGTASPDTLPIWSDHENKVWVDMRTNTDLDHRHYGDG